MSERICISKNKINQLYEQKNIDLDIKDIEYEYYIILISTISLIANQKKIFRKNSELYNFLKDIFPIDYKKYILSNRSLLIGKIIKTITREIDKEDYENYANILNRKINDIISPMNKNEYIQFLQEVDKQ
ncbi:hypothetical protein RSJ2_2182 [Clostridium botulinum]|uniref:hypothetical protein n=1 Tax=Clostridium botulinum TaxID=1491 RepID=UPI000773AE1A|nr:hypothetical protein [Clostridium botulinum]APR00910.1 hypothetical protein RSJ2_2182 [Clostridium botulinum]OSA82614.1 hypothetical protein B2H84_07290 [Clostridium botulinum]